MIQLLTLNLRLEMLLDGINAFSRRKEGLIRCLLSERADVMGFQEMTEGMRTAFRQGLHGYACTGERSREAGKCEYNAIFYREDMLRLEQTGTFWLSATPEKAGSRFLLQSPDARTCTWAMFTHRGSGMRFRYFNTHLDHLSPIARAQGLLVILGRMGTMQREERLPLFFGGDLNFTPRSASYLLCTTHDIGGQQLVDLSCGLQTTFHWFGKLARPLKLDYMFCDSDTAACPFDVRVLRHNDQGGFLSDHDAVAAQWVREMPAFT